MKCLGNNGDYYDFVGNADNICPDPTAQNTITIKEEEPWEDQIEMESLVPGPSKPKNNLETRDVPGSECEFNPKARKYNLKSEVCLLRSLRLSLHLIFLTQFLLKKPLVFFCFQS